MGKIKDYFKRGIKYIRTGFIQPIVHVDIVQRQATEVFDNKVYIVTGGGSGLGYYISKRLIADSAHVIITGRNEQKLAKAKKELGNKCDYYVCDITNQDSSKQLIIDLFKKYGFIDGIVNNAGLSLHEWDFLKVSEDGFDKQFYTNLKGSYFFTQYYINEVKKTNKNGNIVFISSEAGTMCDDLPYGLSKASINSLVKALSFDYYKEGIRINAISPGVTASEMTGISTDSDLYSSSNSGRIFVPEEVSEIVAFILSDYSKCISGEIIHTNAGNHNKRRY